MKTIFPDEIPEEMEELREETEGIDESIKPIVDADEKLRKLTEGTSSALRKLSMSSSMLSAFQGYRLNPAFRSLGKLDLSSVIPQYSFTNPVLQQIKENSALSMSGMYTVSSAFRDYLQRNQEQFRSITNSLRAISESYGNAISNLVQSPVFKWLNTLDAFPIHSILENLHLLEDGLLGRYDKLKEAYLTTLMECKWFPYAAWAADLNLFAEISDIMATSRGASKRREKRIDQAILAYYDKAEIKAIKRNWRQMDIENHIKRILGQAIEAHLRGEYALTISSPSTMWEGLIYIKANNATMQDRHRQRMEKTKKELVALTEANDYNKIFSDYFDQFIVSQCNAVSDVVDGVPNRHGVSHSWYHKYPNKKASLNAILLTDFILSLEPITEERGEDNA